MTNKPLVNLVPNQFNPAFEYEAGFARYLPTFRSSERLRQINGSITAYIPSPGGTFAAMRVQGRPGSASPTISRYWANNAISAVGENRGDSLEVAASDGIQSADSGSRAWSSDKSAFISDDEPDDEYESGDESAGPSL
jgi:hypothetical protein